MFLWFPFITLFSPPSLWCCTAVCMVQWTKLAFLKYKERCSFYLHLCEGSAVQILTRGKLSAPRILRIQKVINYVVEKMVLDKPLDNMDIDRTFAPGLPVGQLQHPGIGGDGSFRLKRWQKLKPSIEILCNNQVSQYIILDVKI